MCAYLSKSEHESSKAKKQAARDAYKAGKPAYERMTSVARTYRTHREISDQEAVTIALRELWLRMTSPCVVSATNNLPKKRYRICCSEEEIYQQTVEICSKGIYLINTQIDSTENFGNENIKYLLKCAVQNFFQIIHQKILKPIHTMTANQKFLMIYCVLVSLLNNQFCQRVFL